MNRFNYSIDTEALIRYVCDRLELWSEYLIQSAGNGSGYPSQVPYVNMMASTTGYRSITLIPVTYDDFVEIDELVHRLPDVLQRVITAEWIWTGHQEDKAERCGITRETYRNRLKWAYTDLIKLGI